MGFNPYTLEVLALALVVASVILSSKRLELGISLHRLNHALLHMGEVRGVLLSNPQGFMNELTGDTITPAMIQKRVQEIEKGIPITEKNIKTAQAKVLKYYPWRNWLLLCGFVGLFVSKILIPYVR